MASSWYKHILYCFFFISSSFSGAQSILELFFSRFIFICSSRSRNTLFGSIGVNVFIATNQLAAVTGGFIADFLLGSFHTQNLSNVIATLGIMLALLFSWQYTPTCCQTTGAYTSQSCLNVFYQEKAFWSWNVFNVPPSVSIVVIVIGLALFSVGNGHLNATQSVFVGDQFPEGQSLEKARSFSWYFVFQNIGELASTFIIPILRQSFGAITTLSAIAGTYGVSTLTFVIGWRWYYHSKAERKLLCCNNTFTVTKSEKIVVSIKKKHFISLFGICLPLIGFWALFFQQNSTWVIQGAMMNCYIGNLHIPPDMMPSINDIMVIILIPILEYLVYPHLRRTMNLHIKPLQKIVAGMVCVTVSFVLAALLQLYITQPLVSCRGRVSILWQIPQLLLVSLAEVLVSVTGLEFTYSQPPPRLRNIYNGVWCVTLGLGAALNVAIAIINLPLVYLFVLYSSLMVLVILMFLIINRNYQYIG